MLNIKKNIEDYLLVYNYMSQKYDRISRIEIFDSRSSASVWYYRNINNGFFNYMELKSTIIDLNSKEFKIFERDYSIGTLLYNPENPTIYDNENITYLRYENMLYSADKIGDYYDCLIKYMRTLKVGNPVYCRGSKAVIDKINLNNNTADIYIHDTQKIVPIVNFVDLKPRRYTKRKPTEELVPELLSKTTKELLNIKNQMYYDFDSGYKPKYTLEDVIDVLNTREHINLFKSSQKYIG